jgi:hypothetical protein
MITSAIFLEESTRAFADDLGILLVTLEHPSMLEPIRAAGSDTDIVSRGLTFLGWPMEPRLPGSGEQQARGGIRIANEDERIGRAARSIKGEVSCSFEIVSRDDPDELIWDHRGLLFTNVRAEGNFIVGDVVGQGGFGTSFPRSSANPEFAPGTFIT